MHHTFINATFQLWWHWNQKIIKSFKGLGYAHSLSCFSCCAKWLVCTVCKERQSNCCRMKAHVEKCSGITVRPFKTQKLLNGKENRMIWSLKVYSTWKRMTAMGTQKRSKKNSAILVYHMLSVHHSLKIIHDMEMGAALIGSKCNSWQKCCVFEMIWQNWNRRLELSEVECCLKKRLIFIC